MKINTYPLVRGLASYIFPKSFFERPGSGGSGSAEYCYSVCLRHLKQLYDNGLIKDSGSLKRVAEIGPGDSLGIGLSFLFSGAEEYYGFDVIKHANSSKNIEVARDIKMFFLDRLDIPHKNHKAAKPYLKDYSFPYPLFKDQLEEDSLENKLQAIEKALEGKDSYVKIEYIVPWYERSVELNSQIDLVFSQAVMEHVEDIRHAYQTMYKFLKPGGIISHQIDYRTHEMTKEWNGHWFISEGMWKILLHGRKYSINRCPHSAHITEIERAGFKIKNVLPVKSKNIFNKSDIKANRYPYTDEDMYISSALIQAVKE